jgi:hypothetical protein
MKAPRIVKDKYGTQIRPGDLVVAATTGTSPNIMIGIIEKYCKTSNSSVHVKYISNSRWQSSETLTRPCQRIIKVPHDALPKSVQENLSLEDYMKILNHIRESKKLEEGQ